MAKELVKEVYALVSGFPKEELYGITAQIKNCSVSVPANIAEGYGRYHYLDKAKFYLNARGSLLELKSHLLISVELGLINGSDRSDTEGIFDGIERLNVNNLIVKTRRFNEQKGRSLKEV